MPEILQAVSEKGYTNPTPIQEKAIPAALSGKDLLATAQTGTGKTAAFAIPIIQKVAESQAHHEGIKALILTPTRELAIQIEENIADYSKHLKINQLVIFGGVKQHQQVKDLSKGVDILVATPGRLLDLHGQGLLDISSIKYFVLDEADRMLDMGFIHDIRKVIKIIPRKRQTLFFSATLAGNIKELSDEMLFQPVRIAVDPPASTADTVTQYLLYTNRDLKKDLLVHLINTYNIDQAIVFTRTKHGADRLARFLKKENFPSAALHGDKAQNNRVKTLNDFKSGKIKYLIATDIAARGIDIDKLGYVINFEIPNESEAYVHRIGRSGRAGEDGVAYSLCEPEENAYVSDIEKLIKQKIEVINGHPFPQTDKPMTEAEKKEWRKEKEARKQAFFAARKENKNLKAKGGKPQRHNAQVNSNVRIEEKPHKKKPKQKSKNASSPQTPEIKANQPSKKKRSHGATRNTEAKTLKDRYMWPLG